VAPHKTSRLDNIFNYFTPCLTVLPHTLHAHYTQFYITLQV